MIHQNRKPRGATRGSHGDYNSHLFTYFPIVAPLFSGESAKRHWLKRDDYVYLCDGSGIGIELCRASQLCVGDSIQYEGEQGHVLKANIEHGAWVEVISWNK